MGVTGGQGAGGNARGNGWRLGDESEDASIHSDVDASMQTDDVGGGLDDSQDSVGQEGRNRGVRSIGGGGRDMSLSPVAKPLRLLRWRPNA